MMPTVGYGMSRCTALQTARPSLSPCRLHIPQYDTSVSAGWAHLQQQQQQHQLANLTTTWACCGCGCMCEGTTTHGHRWRPHAALRGRSVRNSLRHAVAKLRVLSVTAQLFQHLT